MALQNWLDSGAPRQLFFTSPEQRVALARQRFFDEGIRPSGMVAEPVIQSWMRCTAAHSRTIGNPTFDPVTPSRLHGTLNRNQELLQAARQELASMESALAGTDCRVLLTDASGIIVHATHNPMAVQPLLQRAARVGVNVSESVIGTTAPGIVAKTGQACMVLGGEHFYDSLQQLNCAAAPIRDVKGKLAGVLNVSVESRSFGFDAASVIGLYATSIENSLLQAQSRDHLLVQFQASPALIGTPMEAMAGITSDGKVDWLNVTASRLLGQLPNLLPQPVETAFGVSLPDLLDLLRTDAIKAFRLPNGLSVWVRVRLIARNGVDFDHAIATRIATPAIAPVATPSEPENLLNKAYSTGLADETTLVDHSRKFIEDTLAACDGNISRAARALSVSRGTLYRRLKGWQVKASSSGKAALQ